MREEQVILWSHVNPQLPEAAITEFLFNVRPKTEASGDQTACFKPMRLVSQRVINS